MATPQIVVRYDTGVPQIESQYVEDTPVAPVITTTGLPDGIVGTAYSQTIQYTGSTSTFAVQSGSLPDGLTLSSAGVLSGTPTTPVAASFTIRATNASGFDDQALTLHVPNEGTGGDAPVVTTVTLVPATASVLDGDTVDLTVTVEDQDGNPIQNIDGTAASDDEAAATVAILAATDANGEATARVTGVAAGQASITVTYDGVTSNPAVVDTYTITSVVVTPSAPEIRPDFTQQFSASVAGSGTYSSAVTWSVESGIGTISSSGLYTAPSGTGTATIRATSDADPTVFGEATVTVSVVSGGITGVSVSPSSTSVTQRSSVQFTADTTGVQPYSNALTWSVHSGIGTISATGLYTAPSESGSATIRATSVENPIFYGEATLSVSAGIPPTPAPNTSTGGSSGRTYVKVDEELYIFDTADQASQFVESVLSQERQKPRKKRRKVVSLAEPAPPPPEPTPEELAEQKRLAEIASLKAAHEAEVNALVNEANATIAAVQADAEVAKADAEALRMLIEGKWTN